MTELPRLNGIIRALEQGQAAFAAFSPAEIDAAVAMGTSKYDGVVFEMEHNPWDARALRESLQFMLNRRQIATSGSLAPAVTPMVRVPPNGVEKAVARQAGPRPRLLRHRLPAHLHGGRGLQRGGRLPLSAPQDRRALRARRHPRRRPHRRRALLGPDAAGVLRPRRRVAARPQGRDLRHPADRGHQGRREPRRHPQEGPRIAS